MKKEKRTKSKKYDGLEEKLKAWEEANPQATLTEIEEAIDAELAKVRRELTEKLLQGKETREGERYKCPNCGKEMVKNGKRKRRLKAKGGERIELERQQMRCLGCGMTFFPPG